MKRIIDLAFIIGYKIVILSLTTFINLLLQRLVRVYTESVAVLVVKALYIKQDFLRYFMCVTPYSAKYIIFCNNPICTTRLINTVQWPALSLLRLSIRRTI